MEIRRKSNLQKPLQPRNGARLRVIAVARISSDNQDEKSLDDQKALLKRWLRQNYGRRFTLRTIASRGSGELLDRKELRKLRKLIRSKKYDLVIAEDLGRICRRIDAFKICEMSEDYDTRLMAVNDHLDTAMESWRMASFFAAMRHEQYNIDTAKRIRRTLRNRFAEGGVVMTVIFCYEKPPGAKSDADLRKIQEMEPIIEGIVSRLESDWSYSEIADWLNEKKVPTGRWCRTDVWDGAMVRRVVFNPMLKGVRIRNRKMTRRVNSSGHRKSINAPPEELLERSCPHLAFVSAERYDSLIAKLQELNSHYAVGRLNKIDPRLGRPKRKTTWPGQHVTCGICGRGYVYGGHGRTKYLMCSGARLYKCWNGVTFEATAAARNIAAAVMQAISEIPDFDEVYATVVGEAIQQQGSSRAERLSEVNAKLAQCDRRLGNVMQAITDTGGMPALYAQLKQLESERAALVANLRDIDEERQIRVELPSLADLRQLAFQSFENLPRESYDFAKLMKRLIKTIVVNPVRLIDGGDIVLRATFRLSLVRLAPQLRKLPVEPHLSRELTVNLFEDPQRVSCLADVVKMIGEGIYQRETGKALGITQPAVQKALKLHGLMQAAGIVDPYLAVTEAPADYSRLSRHKHSRYRFDPLPPING